MGYNIIMVMGTECPSILTEGHKAIRVPPLQEDIGIKNMLILNGKNKWMKPSGEKATQETSNY
jgi:hypothetical protein